LKGLSQDEAKVSSPVLRGLGGGNVARLPGRVNVHDFGEKDENGRRIKVIPYEVYDILEQQGFVSVGLDHGTAAFAVESRNTFYASSSFTAYN